MLLRLNLIRVNLQLLKPRKLKAFLRLFSMNFYVLVRDGKRNNLEKTSAHNVPGHEKYYRVIGVSDSNYHSALQFFFPTTFS